jgi:hypothetical protein
MFYDERGRRRNAIRGVHEAVTVEDETSGTLRDPCCFIVIMR